MSETRGQCPAHQSNTNGVSSPNVFGVAFMDADYPVKIKKELPKVNGKGEERQYGLARIIKGGSVC